jgi:hypothetical protein
MSVLHVVTTSPCGCQGRDLAEPAVRRAVVAP